MMPSSAIDARLTLALLAGSQPAVTKLASLPRIHQRSRHQSRRATPRSLVHTDVSDHAWPQADRGNPYNPASASPNPRQNPHSARGTAPAYVPRFRALALFGRRPQERVEGFVMPASKNLHRTGLGEVKRSPCGFSAISPSVITHLSLLPCQPNRERLTIFIKKARALVIQTRRRQGRTTSC